MASLLLNESKQSIECGNQSGFCVEYEIRESPGKGLGLFAKNHIPANTMIWKFIPGGNVRIFRGEAEVLSHLSTLDDSEKYDWLSHVYVFDGCVNEILDDGKMWNHSEVPNCASGYCGDWDSTYALRDISPGEELLDDYGAYEYPDWFLRICSEHRIPQDFFTIKSTASKSNAFANESPGFHIDYEVKESGPEMGLGIFTKQFIPKGTLIWKYVRGRNVLSYKGYEEAKRRLEQLSPEEQSFWMSHVYMFDGYLNEIQDDALRWNHSEYPNTGYGTEGDWQSSYAIRDILPGEELLDDYGIYEYPEWFTRLYNEYHVPHDFISVKDSKKPGFHIDYEVRVSPGKGLGLFAKQFIPKDSLIWKISPNHNAHIYTSREEVVRHVNEMSSVEDTRQWLSRLYGGNYNAVEILDDARLWNHSDEPNCGGGLLGDTQSTYALRDIETGEELTENYGCFEWPLWLLDLLDEYGVKREYFTITSLVETR